MQRLAFALIALVATACAAMAQATLRTMVTTDIRGLMPGISTDDNTGTVLQQIYEGLVAWRADGSVAPMLAQDIAMSADGRSYTFTLREGVRFHNGAPLTSKEVAWTWERLLDVKSGWGCRANFDGTRQMKIAAIETPDPSRVVFRLAEPNATFLSTMARSDCDSAGIAHPDSVGPDGNWKNAIGTGPFRLVEWRRGEFIELERHGAYASRSEPADGLAGAKAAKIDRLRFTIVPDPSTAKTALQSGDLDVWPVIDPKFAKELAARPNIAVASAAVAAINTVVMQTNDPVLSDKRIRQAINAALDYQGLSESLTEGYAKPNTSPIPLSSRYFGAVQKAGHAHDVARAKRLLAEAGYRGQQLTILTNSRFAIMNDTAILIQAMAQQAGVNMKVEVVEFATQLDRYVKGNYQLMVWNYTPYLDPIFVFDRFIGDKAKQADRVWSNPQAIALFNKLASVPTPEDMQPVFDDLHRLFIDDSPMVVWSSATTVTAFSKALRGYAPWPGRKARYWNVEVVR